MQINGLSNVSAAKATSAPTAAHTANIEQQSSPNDRVTISQKAKDLNSGSTSNANAAQQTDITKLVENSITSGDYSILFQSRHLVELYVE
ncbi:MAG: hypothetical protein HQL08_14460 [Nitrospirae bacterium]|nr:hypothetical protein [Nitrospirota bacterium]